MSKAENIPHPRPAEHYSDVTMGSIASQITSLTIVYSAVYSGADQRKHQSFASLAFVRGIHRGPGNSPHKWPVTRKMFPFDDVIMVCCDYAYFVNPISVHVSTVAATSLHIFQLYEQILTCENNVMWLYTHYYFACIHDYLACIHKYLACIHNYDKIDASVN